MQRGDFSKSGVWICLALVIFISLVVILMNSDITGGVTIQTISLIKEGAPLHISVREVKNVNTIWVTVLKDTRGGTIEVKDIKQVSWNHPGKVISMFKVYSDKADHFGSLRITLKVLEKDLQGIKPNDIKLYHEGKELVTTAGERSRGYIEYTVQSPSMGEFVIGEKKPETIKQEITVVEPANEPIVQQPSPPTKLSIWERFKNFLKEFIDG